MTQKYDEHDYKRDIRQEQQESPHSHAPHPVHTSIPTPTLTRRPSRFWLLMLSPLPGLGHMYLGLIRRGLFYMASLALLIFLTTVLAPSALVIFTGFAMAALFGVAFFEAFAIRRSMVMGKEVADTIPNIAFIAKNKTILAIALAVLAVIIGINILGALPWYAWVVIGIVAVCYIGTRVPIKR